MKLSNLKTYKVLLISSLVFFIGMTAFGIIPSLITDVSIWEQSFVTKGFGILFGFAFIFSMITYIYLSISSIKPFNTKSNYLKLVNVSMLIALYSFILPDVSYFSTTQQTIIFGIFGVVIITSNIISIIMIKSEERFNDKFRNEDFISKLKQITNDKNGKSLFYFIFWAILMVSLSNGNYGYIEIYIGIVLLNGWILYKFIKSTRQNQNQIKILILITALYGITSIILLEVFPNFLIFEVSNYQVLLILLPTLYLFPQILKNYYSIMWKNHLELE